MRQAHQALKAAIPAMTVLFLALGSGSAPAQEAAPDLEARARALAAERLAPILETLRRQQPTAQPAGVRFLVRFAGSVQGLADGGPVTMRGLRVGTVREVAVTFDSGSGRLDVPVVIDLVPGSLVLDGERPMTAETMHAALATLVSRGLRAQLASTSLLSADREVALDLVPDASPASLGPGPEPEIPTVATRMDQLSATLDRLVAQAGNLPLDRLAAEAEASLVALHDLVTAPEVRQALVDMAAAAGELRGTAGELAQRAGPLIASLTRTADAAGPELRAALANLTAISAELRDLPSRLEARTRPLLTSAVGATAEAGQAAADARRTIAALDATFGSRSTFQADLQALLREVTGAARAMRQLLDLVQRQPDVLIRGKQGGPPP